MKKFVAFILIAIVLSACSGTSNSKTANQESSTSNESPISPLSPEEKSKLIESVKILNVSFDDFEEAYVFDSRPSKICPGHTIWIQAKSTNDGYVVGDFYLLTQDDINNNIGQPGGVLVKRNGITSSYLVNSTLGLDNLYCGGSEWAYQSRQSISTQQGNLDKWIRYFKDTSTKFRLLDSYLEGDYRDVNLTTTQFESNLVAIKAFEALANKQITPKELFGQR